jgi:hypothetical protein
VLVQPGQRVERGAPVAEIHASNPSDAALARRELAQALTIGEPERAAEPLPLISHHVSREGVLPWDRKPG